MNERINENSLVSKKEKKNNRGKYRGKKKIWTGIFKIHIIRK